MRVMATTNINTNREVANGAQGEVLENLLDAREPFTQHSTLKVALKYPPTVLVKLGRTSGGWIVDLEDGVVPIFPIE